MGKLIADANFKAMNGRLKNSLDYDVDSDGMEIIYIELPKIDNDNVSDELRKMLVSIRDGDDLVKVVKEICGLNTEEVSEMLGLPVDEILAILKPEQITDGHSQPEQ